MIKLDPAIPSFNPISASPSKRVEQYLSLREQALVAQEPEKTALKTQEETVLRSLPLPRNLSHGNFLRLTSSCPDLLTAEMREEFKKRMWVFLEKLSDPALQHTKKLSTASRIFKKAIQIEGLKEEVEKAYTKTFTTSDNRRVDLNYVLFAEKLPTLRTLLLNANGTPLPFTFERALMLQAFIQQGQLPEMSVDQLVELTLFAKEFHFAELEKTCVMLLDSKINDSLNSEQLLFLLRFGIEHDYEDLIEDSIEKINPLLSKMALSWSPLKGLRIKIEEINSSNSFIFALAPYFENVCLKSETAVQALIEKKLQFPKARTLRVDALNSPQRLHVLAMSFPNLLKCKMPAKLGETLTPEHTTTLAHVQVLHLMGPLQKNYPLVFPALQLLLTDPQENQPFFNLQPIRYPNSQGRILWCYLGTLENEYYELNFAEYPAT